MADIEVHIDLKGLTRQVGLARSNKVRGNETIVFEYAPEWLADTEIAVAPRWTMRSIDYSAP